MFCTRWRRGGRAATFETPKTTRICVELKSWGSWWCSGVIWTISQDPVIKWNTEGSKQKQQQKKLQLKFCLGFVLTPHTQSPGYFYPLCSCWKSLRLSLLIQKLNSWIFSISLPSLLFSLLRLSTGSLSLSLSLSPVSIEFWFLIGWCWVEVGGSQSQLTVRSDLLQSVKLQTLVLFSSRRKCEWLMWLMWWQCRRISCDMCTALDLIADS